MRRLLVLKFWLALVVGITVGAFAGYWQGYADREVEVQRFLFGLQTQGITTEAGSPQKPDVPCGQEQIGRVIRYRAFDPFTEEDVYWGCFSRGWTLLSGAVR